MPTSKEDFFKKKKIWSEVKDKLLGYYLRPYFSKIMKTQNSTLYVDCFAGKGKFDDSKLGSPLIAFQCLNNCLSQSGKSRFRPNIRMCFIELNYADDLRNHLSDQPTGTYSVIEGKFEEKIMDLLHEEHKHYEKMNVFLYVDPYGVKALDASMFGKLPDMFSTAEVLINLNTFGFIREACRAMKVVFRENAENILEDIVEYDSSTFNSIDELDVVAGGDYWQSIIKDYQNGKINCYQAEREFSKKYKLRLRESYRYVLSMPIRLKPGHHPKYRMVYATNHSDGCLLMADSIANAIDYLVVEIQDGGQRSIFPQTAENEYIEESFLKNKVLELLAENPGYTHLNELMAEFFNKNGVICDKKRLSSGKSGSILKTLESEGEILVQRFPALTTKKKQPSNFWNEDNGKSVKIKLK